MPSYIFQSERLGFRHWVNDDIVPFAEMCNDPFVMEFFPKRLSLQETNELVERIKKHFAENGYGLYAVDILDTQTFIGFIGFATPRFEAFFTPCIEIGWRLKRDSWGQGFATEGASKCLEYGFQQLNFREVFSFTSENNQRSVRVMQKIGMQLVGSFEHPLIEEGNKLRKHVLYKVSNAPDK